ncbi:MAG: dephospho-CoA kinase [bacterium]
MSKLIIGITGRFASGKTTVAKLFKEEGFYEIDVDSYGYKALSDKKNEIVKKFGTHILNNDNKINRKKLGEIVFNSETQLKQLNEIVHPYMKSCIKYDIEHNVNHNKIIINAALLIPMKLHSICSKIIYVKSDINNIIKRGIERDNRNKKQISFILSNQPTTKQLSEIADYIIENNKDINTLVKNTKKLIEKIRSENIYDSTE